MSKSLKAGVIVKTRFVDKSYSKNGKAIGAFSDYINYIDRSQATRNDNFIRYNLSSQYENYNDYMGNPEKSSGIFTAGKDKLSKDDLSALKQTFQAAYDNDNIMWQTVVSFDNQFLVQLGIYDPDTGILDERILHESVRRMMRTTLKEENMYHTAVWSASIHYNTDNIHIHIAYTEPSNTRPKKVIDGQERPRGYFSAKTFREMKSKMVNTLLENEYTMVDKLVRERFVGSKRRSFTPDDKLLRDLWYRIYDNLPEDKRQWFYNMNGMKPLRPLLDELSRQYLNRNHPEDYMQFQKLIMKQQSIYQTAYGFASNYQGYSKNKMDDLYTRMGNAVLSEMRLYSRSPYLFIDKHYGDMHRKHPYVSGRLKNALGKAFDETRQQNEREHQKLQADLQQGGY